MNAKKKPAAPPVEEMVLKPAGAVSISPAAKPRPGAEDLKIHARRPLPAIPDRAPAESDTEATDKN